MIFLISIESKYIPRFEKKQQETLERFENYLAQISDIKLKQQIVQSFVQHWWQTQRFQEETRNDWIFRQG